MQQLLAAFDALYRFSRPHTMLGTFVSIVSVSSMALGNAAWSGAALAGLCQALVPALLMNIAIVGINQVYDVEIDKVNKPYLPLASGDLSMQQGVGIVAGTAALSLLLGVLSGSPPLLATLLLSLVLGVLYSMELPFMRWKRSPWLAALCILAVRAVMVQLGFFLHMQHSLGVTGLVVTRPLGFTMIFMLLFSVVIALFKDIPDVKGDTQAGVLTFSVRHGVKAIFWTCVGVLMAAYAGGIAFAFTSPEPWSRVPVAVGHAALGALLWSRSAEVNVGRKQELTDHYMFVWKLFYAEYLIIPFLR
ncbi:UbiA prenyltransferase family [Scenedesmus sp. NREL 46B-D3]|nr:UbiA prenyltransferase family [Scenedesmus sp. NREL 46B-D3]